MCIGESQDSIHSHVIGLVGGVEISNQVKLNKMINKLTFNIEFSNDFYLLYENGGSKETRFRVVLKRAGRNLMSSRIGE